MYRNIFCVLAALIILSGCSKEDKIIQQQSFATALTEVLSVPGIELNTKDLLLPATGDFESVPHDPNNPITKEKVRLGQMLLHETRLGGIPRIAQGIYTYSCASCHHSDAAFQSGLAQGIGEGGIGFGLKGEGRVPSTLFPDSVDVSPVRTPSLLNIAYQEVMLWGGQFGSGGVNSGTDYAWTGKLESNFLGYAGPESQAIGAQSFHRLKVDTAWFRSNAVYKKLFDKAFAAMPAEQRISPVTVGLAIAAYERVLLPNEAPFQRWLRGDSTAMSAEEIQGAKLFFGKAKCVNCHTGPALNSMKFSALGMNDLQNGINGAINIKPDNAESKGRGGFTLRDSDMYKFKVPQLYNLKDVRFFGHGTSFTSVEQVVRYINKAVPQNPKVPIRQLAPEFVPLQLTDDEIYRLVKFIEVSLYDPNLAHYAPVSVPSGNCIPNNDLQSKKDRGCF